MVSILTVDDEPVILNLLNKILRAEGYEVTPCTNGEEAKKLLTEQSFDLLISDIKMEPVSGIELLNYTRKHCPETEVIMLTAYGTVSTAVEAMKAGAYDYITKPFKLDELKLTIQRALAYQNILAENRGLKLQLYAKHRLENIVAESPSMRKICDMIERIAPTNTTILIYGESGTGKEVVAKALHANSPRKDKMFMPVNCAALPEALMESEMFGHIKGAFTGASSDKVGLFEAATGGTLFLDEISSMPLNIQSKLLRALQDKTIRKVGGTSNVKIDVRVIAASNQKLKKLIHEGKFREDLYYRLSVITLDIPPIRERPEDILPLVQHTLQNHLKDGQEMPLVDHKAQTVLENYSWPGNVRELENVIQHALAFARDNRITCECLPANIIEAVDLKTMNDPKRKNLDEYRGKSLKSFLLTKEQEYLKDVIERMDGDKVKAAKALNISVATLYRKLPNN